MPRFVQFKREGSNVAEDDLAVNVDAIASIEETRTGARIVFVGGSDVQVKANLQLVLRQIQTG